VVGSLRRPSDLREARQGAREGRVTPEVLRAIEDRAVREAIALQETAGLDVITDGELRRSSWVITIPLREEGAARAPLAGFEFLPAAPGWWSLWKEPDGRPAQVWTNPTRPFVTRPIEVVRDVVSDEYAFLKAHARARTKFTIPSPSWHRIFWHRDYSRAAYPTPEDFLRAIARYLREQVVPRLIALGGDYVQMDAPNYAQWHVDRDNRAAFEAWGHDMAAELVADAEIDDSVFEDIHGVTRAIHICRGNARTIDPKTGKLVPQWHREGSYDAIAEQLFTNLNHQRLLLEYDGDRAGSLEPLRFIPKNKVAVLGLVSTKSSDMESVDDLKRRIDQASKFLPLDQLALSPQCGFSTSIVGNRISVNDEKRKLKTIVETVQTVWR